MNKRTLWNKAGRFVTGVVILCFFLPFFGVSCEGMDVITVSGADMIGGCKPGGMMTEMTEQGGENVQGEVPKVNIEPLAIAAMAIAVISFGLAWVRTKKALLASLILAIAGLGVLAGLYVKIRGDLDEGVKLELEKEANKMGGRGKREVSVDAGARMGFWLTALGFIGVAALSGLALKEPDEGTTPRPPRPPPAA